MRGIGRREFGALAGAALAAAPGVARAQAPSELRLGAIFPLSGSLAPLGDESFRGVELAVEERAASGGVLGRPLRLMRADAADEAAAAAEARRLTSGAERVSALFGSFSSTVALPASQVAEAAGVPFFELGALGDGLIERGFRWVFRVSPRAADFAAVAVSAVGDVLAPGIGVSPEALRLAILHEDAPGGQSAGTAQEAGIRARGLRLVERLAYASRAADLSAAVQRLRGLETEVVLHTGAPGDEVILLRAMRDAAWQPRMVIGTAGGYGVAETARLLGDELRGVMSADLTPFEVNEAYAPGARSFAELYLRRYGAEPRSGHGLACFVGARIALDALQRAGGVEKERVRAAMLAADLAEGMTATGWGARFDERGQNLRARPVLCQWQAAGNGLRQVVVAPPAAAVVDAVARLGG